MRVCSRIYFFLCAIWSGAWPILNARRLTFWNRSTKIQKCCHFSPKFLHIRQQIAKYRQIWPIFYKSIWNLTNILPKYMKSDHNFTYMTKTLHDTERTEKVVPHLAKKFKNCKKCQIRIQNQRNNQLISWFWIRRTR